MSGKWYLTEVWATCNNTPTVAETTVQRQRHMVFVTKSG